jgi:UDP-glucose 4-epimerase
MEMTTIAVTGVSGRVGTRLVEALDRSPDTGRIVGLDLREPSFRPRSLAFRAVDIGTGDLKPLLEGVDTLVHLAALVVPVPDEDVMARVNVEGTRRLLEAAAATGVSKVVLVSSASVYGAWPDNPLPITEDAPLRPNPSFAFGVHKAEVERMLVEWRDEHPGVVTTALRAPFVLGGDTPAAVRALVRRSLPFRVREGAAEVQYLHVDDLVSALVLAVEEDLAGPFNVAPDGWLTADAAAALVGVRPAPPVSADVAERLVARLWASGIGNVPPGSVPLLAHTCVLANDRLRARGWAPRHRTEDALMACFEEVGAGEPGRRARTLTLALGAAGAAALASWAWRRRR